MDAFKPHELARMAAGGNKPWRDFFDAHAANRLEGRAFDECTIQDRYEGAVGEEWKARLSAKVEGREWAPEPAAAAGPTRLAARAVDAGSAGRAHTPLAAGAPRSASPALAAAGSKRAQNEAYFARMGAANAGRPAELPPNQGGKYAGFGSEPTPRGGGAGDALPGVDEFQRDPVAALTKGFGWLSSTVGKGAKTGYEGWVKPGVQKVGGAPCILQAVTASWL